MPYFPLRLSIPLLIVAFSLLIGLYNFDARYRTVEEATEQRVLVELRHRLEQLQSDLEHFVVMRNPGLVQESIGSLSRDPQIAFALVTDAHRRIIGAQRTQYLGQELHRTLPQLPPAAREAATALLARKAALRTPGRLLGDGSFAAGALPIQMPDGGAAGAVLVGLDLRPAKRAARASVAAQATEFSLFLAALAGLVTVLFHFGVTRRMGPILHVVSGLSEGRFDRRTHLRGRDELGVIAQAVDRAAERVGRTEAGLREAQRIGRLGSWEIQAGSGLFHCSGETLRIVGRSPHPPSMTFKSLLEQVHPDDRARVAALSKEMESHGLRAGHLQYRIIRPNGEMRWLDSRWRIEPGTRPRRLHGTSQDITEQKLAEQALFEAKERALVTLHSIGDAVITTCPAGRVDYLNPVAEELTGWTTAEAHGRPLREVFDIVNEETGEPAANPVETCLREGRIVGLANHTVLVSRGGGRIAIEDSAAPIRDGDGRIRGVVMVFHDVSTQRELTHRLNWQASHDALTGLYNRYEFERRLHDALDDAHATDRHHALIYFDLDQFKIVNDSAGHTAGDELLRQIPVVLRQATRDADILARLGGDEFALILYGCTMADARHVADKLLSCIRGFRFVWEDRAFEVGASFGVVPINSESGSAGDVLTAADITCYSAKDHGRGRIHSYRPGDEELTRRHGEIQLVSAINRALDEDRFRLYVQPIVPCDGIGHQMHEVLVRMVDESGAEVLPGGFIPAAERFDLMPALDRWVVRRALQHYERACLVDSRVFCINLSGTSLSDEGFLQFLYNEIGRSTVPPSAICFEITETAAIANLARTRTFMRDLKALGCLFSLDDFGAGVSSFAYLKNLPVDFLKIDGGFVRDMLEDPIDYALVESINNIGHVLGIRTVAEFVEDTETLHALRVLGVDFAQGFGVQVPHPLAEAIPEAEAPRRISGAKRNAP